MREYSQPLQKSLIQGLRPSSKLAQTAQFLNEATGFRCTPTGLAAPATIRNPLSYTTHYTATGYWTTEGTGFGIPQLIRGKGMLLLADSTSLYSVYPSYALEEITTYDAYNPSMVKGIPVGGPWHFVDMYKTWMLINGACTVFKMNSFGMFDEDEFVFVEDSVTIRTGCYHRGRVLLGGFDSSNFYNADWEAIIRQLRDNSDIQLSYLDEPGQNFVFWSTIGGGDLLNIFYPEIATFGNIKEDTSATLDEPLFFDYLRRNECGLMPMPYSGAVLCMKPIGKQVVAYGENGIALLRQAQEPVPTYGLEGILQLGIADRGAVGGNEHQHLFMDTYGCLWLLTGEGVKRLGYEAYFSGYLGYPVSIVYNEQEEEFYISGGATPTGYVLSHGGLSKLREAVVSGYTEGSEFLGTTEPDGYSTGVCTTEVLDFGHTELITIGMVEIKGEGLSGAYARAEYKYGTGSTFRSSSWKKVNNRGFVYIGITAKDIKLTIRVADYTQAQINSIVVHWKQSSRSTTRGLYVNQAGQE